MPELQQTNIIDELGRVHPPSLMDAQFQKFHKENPRVYQELVQLARQAHERGREKIGMRMLFEVVRWNRFLQTTDPQFKLNNNYCSRYARLIMADHPEFGEIFETREQKT